MGRTSVTEVGKKAPKALFIKVNQNISDDSLDIAHHHFKELQYVCVPITQISTPLIVLFISSLIWSYLCKAT